MRVRKKRARKTGPYKSKLESIVAKRLGKKAKYESEKLKYVIVKNYIPDFIITEKDGSKKYIEVKGYLRYEDQVKMKAVRYSHPDLHIEMWFPKDQKVHTSSMLNSEWCERYGFICQFI